MPMASDDATRRYVRYLRVLGTLCGITLIVYLLDYALLRVRRPEFGSVNVHRFYRIPLKNGKTELQYDGDYTYQCARSLLPHSGLQPCWYLSRHTEEWIDIQSGTPNNPHIF